MFKLQSQRIFEDSVWDPSGGSLAYLEAWERGESNERPSPKLREGYVDDHEMEEWLYQRGIFQSQYMPSVRLLFCDRVGWKPLGFAMSSPSYIKMEEVFGLGDQVLPLFSNNGGQKSCCLKYSREGDALESLEFTVKWPQMYQLGNCGFTLKHDFSTQTTVCFLHGWDMVSPTDEIPASESVNPYYAIMRDHIRSAAPFWSHPLFLPTIFLAEHISRAEKFRGKISSQVVQLEQELGVTRVGRLSWEATKKFEAIQRLISNRKSRTNLTAELNSRITDVTNFGTVLKWIVRYCQFLEKHKDLVQKLNPHPSEMEHRELEQYLNSLIDDAASITADVEALKSRLELQLSVLYNFVAQVDNDLNARIAYRAGLDGTAMKTLAYVTTIFLPPTFIASLFSMSMFDWQASTGSPGESVVLVPDFWIYWVISVPLTLAILAGWRVWWRFEKRALQSEYSVDRKSS
ncbi:hypothetical protein HD806DRAFT_497218 [Xylariaceae sp. AK1471]|nr:hypothetical protein HD806DRAFT_497218 [Xylariaceae sp. AK1471]